MASVGRELSPLGISPSLREGSPAQGGCKAGHPAWVSRGAGLTTRTVLVSARDLFADVMPAAQCEAVMPVLHRHGLLRSDRPLADQAYAMHALLTGQPPAPDLASLQAQLDTFRQLYNTARTAPWTG
jgi:hypothetical protein